MLLTLTLLAGTWCDPLTVFPYTRQCGGSEPGWAIEGFESDRTKPDVPSVDTAPKPEPECKGKCKPDKPKKPKSDNSDRNKKGGNKHNRPHKGKPHNHKR